MKSGKTSRLAQYKRKFTRFSMLGAYHCPFLFPGWLVHEARNRMTNHGSLQRPAYDENVQTISLFEGDFEWNKCTISFLVSKKNLDLVARWMMEFSLSGFDSDRYKNLNDGALIFGSSWHNLGNIRINKDHHFDNLKSLYLDTKYIDSVSIFLDKYGFGLFVLRYEVILEKTATQLVRDISVKEPVFDAELRSFNIYSAKNRGYRSVSKVSSAEEALLENVNAVYRDVYLVWESLNRIIGIDIDASNCSSISEICVLDEFPYFEPNFCRINQDEIIGIGRHHPTFMRFSEGKNAIVYPTGSIDYPFDGFYLYNFNEGAEKNGYPRNYPPEIRNALIKSFSFSSIISNEINHIAEITSGVVYNDSDNQLIRKNKHYFTALYKTESLLKWVGVFKKSSGLTSSKYFNDEINNLLDYQEKRALEARATLSSLYEFSGKRLEVKNIEYNKRYSLVVFFFIIIQVILAVLAIDWSKPWFENIKKFF